MLENYLSPYVRLATSIVLVLLANWHAQGQSPTKLIYTQQSVTTADDRLNTADLTGTFPVAGTALATGPSSFSQPNDVVFNPTNNFIYLVDNTISTGPILRYLYDPVANTVSGRTIIVPGTPSATYQGLALDIANNRLYFTQSNTNAFNSLDALKVASGVNGSSFPITQLIDGQTGNGNFNSPNDLVFDSANNYIYLIDQTTQTGPILRFTTNGTSVSNRTVVVAPTSLTSTAYGGLALDALNNKLYFTQYTTSFPFTNNALDAIKVVTLSGATPYTPNTVIDGTKAAFTQPTDLVLDRANNLLYVANQTAGSATNFIMRYTTTGTEQTTVVTPFTGAFYGGITLNGGFFAAVNLTSSTPADGATGVNPTANIELTFNRSVIKGTGNFEIRRTSDNVVVETIAVTSSQVTGSGTIWTIDPLTTLAPGTTYALRAASGIFTAPDGGSYAGIADNTTLNFTTNAAPVINPQSFTVNENVPNGTVVGAVAASDPDPGTTLSYSILSGNTSGAFTLVGNSLRVANSAALNFETTPTFSLSIQVSDGSLTRSALVTVNVDNINELSVSITAMTNVSCNGGSDGTATATATGENSPYSFTYRNTTTNTTLAQTGSAVTGLTAGTYSVTVTATNSGFSASSSFTINQPTALSLTSASTNVSTLGASTGTASVSVTGGTPSYAYDWTPANPTGDGTSSISGLSAGTYTVKVTDANGCTATASAIVATDPDLTPLLYARPTLFYKNAPLSVVIDVVEINSVPTSGTITLKITKDAKATLSFDGSLTSVDGRDVQNGSWTYIPDANYYILTTTQSVAGGDKLSVGLVGQASAANTTGTVTYSATLTGGSGGESKTNNNTDADKIDYFQQ